MGLGLPEGAVPRGRGAENTRRDGAGNRGQDGPCRVSARGGTPRQALGARSRLTSPRPWGPRASQSPGLWPCPAPSPPEPLPTLRPLPGMHLLGEPVPGSLGVPVPRGVRSLRALCPDPETQ